MGTVVKILIIAVIAGLLIGILLMKKSGISGSAKQSGILFSYDAQIRNQAVLDTMTGGHLITWFQEQKTYYPQPLIFFVAKPSEQTSAMFGLNQPPSGLDREHYLLQAVVDADKKLPLNVRLISFGTLPEDIEKILNEKGFAEKGYVIILPSDSGMQG